MLCRHNPSRSYDHCNRPLNITDTTDYNTHRICAGCSSCVGCRGHAQYVGCRGHADCIEGRRSDPDNRYKRQAKYIRSDPDNRYKRQAKYIRSDPDKRQAKYNHDSRYTMYNSYPTYNRYNQPQPAGCTIFNLYNKHVDCRGQSSPSKGYGAACQTTRKMHIGVITNCANYTICAVYSV